MTPLSQPFLNTREDEAVRFLGIPTLIRANGESTNGSFGLVEQWEMPPGFATPYHMHRLEDESFYILEGEVAFVCDGKWLTAGPGNFIFGPRMIPHGFKIVGTTPARMLVFASPAGFENFVIDLSVPLDDFSPPDMAKLMSVAAKYQIDILGPLPE
jgi:quercetin dioxygenase-like cupin family protein